MKRRELEQHRRHLGDIRSIMASMKSLAMMEERKLEHYLGVQRQVLVTMETVADDFLGHYPRISATGEAEGPFYLLIGSERGFCGDFNEQLGRYFVARIGDRAGGVMVLGQKLGQHLAQDPRVTQILPGPMVTEEIPACLNSIVQALEHHLPAGLAGSVRVVYQDATIGRIEDISLLPPFQGMGGSPPRYGHAPLLNLRPAQLLAKLIDSYLFALLHGLLYSSMLMENRRRVQHLEGAVQRIDDKLEQFRHRAQMLRQEEITEEIEVIMLAADDEGSAPAAEAKRRHKGKGRQ